MTHRKTKEPTKKHKATVPKTGRKTDVSESTMTPRHQRSDLSCWKVFQLGHHPLACCEGYSQISPNVAPSTPGLSPQTKEFTARTPRGRRLRKRYRPSILSNWHCDILLRLPHWLASRRQKSVTLSSSEAEYVALTDAAKEAIHLRRVIVSSTKTSTPTFRQPYSKTTREPLLWRTLTEKTQARTNTSIFECTLSGTMYAKASSTSSGSPPICRKPTSLPNHWPVQT